MRIRSTCVFGGGGRGSFDRQVRTLMPLVGYPEDFETVTTVRCKGECKKLLSHKTTYGYTVLSSDLYLTTVAEVTLAFYTYKLTLAFSTYYR